MTMPDCLIRDTILFSRTAICLFMMEVLKMNFFFTSPAQEWEETLPIGNGSLGGMIFGSFPEKIGLNDELLWSGYEYRRL